MVEFESQPDSPEVISELVSLLCITVVSVLYGSKTFNMQYHELTYGLWLVVALYPTSWAFLANGLLLVSTNDGTPFKTAQPTRSKLMIVLFIGNQISCFLSEVACNVFYASTKVIFYLW